MATNSQTSRIVQPETYTLQPTKFVPNSNLPVLVYRQVLPTPADVESTVQFLESHMWEKRGVWGMIKTHHYHSITHECYGIFQGASTLHLGSGPLDDIGTGIDIHVSTGDVIVIPAGVAHCSINESAKGEYRYCGVYPQKAPKWDNNYCKTPEETDLKAAVARKVAMPEQDPVYGSEGPLMQIWDCI